MSDYQKSPDLARQIAELSSRLSALERTPTFVSGERQMRAVRGVVDVTGGVSTPLEGQGYSVVYNGVGDHTITFDPPFSDRPSVDVWPVGGARASTEHGSSPADGITVRLIIFTTNTGNNADCDFHFKAVGPA